MKIPTLDLIALAWFICCWAGYTFFADYKGATARSLLSITHAYRHAWMQELLHRDNRIVDSNLIGNLMRSVSFFASTSIFIIAGLVTVLGATEQAINVTAELPFARHTSRELWELKLLLLLGISVYAFFKFTWSLRQFNYLSILIGCAPRKDDFSRDHEKFALKAGQINSFAGDEFNRGLRAYYFALAALTWFIQPWWFIISAALIVIMLFRREYASHTLRALLADEVKTKNDSRHM